MLTLSRPCLRLSDSDLRRGVRNGAQRPQTHAAGEPQAEEEEGGDAPAGGAAARAGWVTLKQKESIRKVDQAELRNIRNEVLLTGSTQN